MAEPLVSAVFANTSVQAVVELHATLGVGGRIGVSVGEVLAVRNR